MFYAISELSSGRIEAIIASKQKLHAGDIVLYEMQTVCEHHAYVPADYEMHIWEATRTLTEAGIIVIMAAGNGGLISIYLFMIAIVNVAITTLYVSVLAHLIR